MTETGQATALSRGSWYEWQRISALLRTESIGGILLLIAAILALIFANTGLADTYFGVRGTYLGGEVLGLDLRLSIGHWAADGLLAVFFFMVGLELKQEFVAGDLRNPRRALVPVVAAFGGVAMPAIIFAIINMSNPEALNGWAIPTATDIAFAVAVLAVIGSAMPIAMRTFLLTLAIVDDLIAITIIAIFYATDLNLGYLFASLGVIAVYGVIANMAEKWFRGHLGASWFLLLPLGVVAWALLLNSGIHATIAGVLLAFTLPVHPRGAEARHEGLAHQLEHYIRPLSAGVCVPIFAFFSAGVAIGGFSGLANSLGSTVALGIIFGLVAGKMIGITGITFITTRFKGVSLDKELSWIDMLGLSALAGIGFTVSLLVNELSFGQDSALGDMGKVGILTASLLAAIIGSLIVVPRNRYYKKIAMLERMDSDADGVPDVFEGPGEVTATARQRADELATDDSSEEDAAQAIKVFDDAPVIDRVDPETPDGPRI